MITTTSMTPRRAKSPRRAQLLLLISSTIFSFMFLEVMLRLAGLFEPFPRIYVGEYANRPSLNFVADQATGWRMRPQHRFSWEFGGVPSTYRSNSRGFRGNSDFDPAETRKKILLAGDSFTFGTGVEYEETFGALIEARLRQAVVYNLAMPGFGVDQIWMSVRHQALAMKPSLIIVGFIDADFDRSLTAFRQGEGFNKPTFVLRDGRLVPESAGDRANLLVQRLERHSRLWTAGRQIGRSLAHRIAFGDWLSLNEMILNAIQTDCRENGVSVLFVRLLSKGDTRHFQTLRSFMDGIGANYIDLRDKEPPPRDNYFVTDDHINAKGHRYVAEAILQWIRNNRPELTHEDEKEDKR